MIRQIQFHPDNVPEEETVGKHCWHPVPPPPVGFRNRQTGNEVICCHCGTEAIAAGEPQSWHGQFAAPQTIAPFFYIEGHAKEEPCAGPPPEKSRIIQ